MKKWPVCAALLTMTLAGCSGNENYFALYTELNRPMFAPVGEALIEWEQGVRESGAKVPTEAFHYSLLYSGLAGRTLNVTYREYWTSSATKLIQPVFTQDLKYELGQDGKAIITFKDIQIEIAEATTERVAFHVTHGPSGARTDVKKERTRSDEKQPVNIYPN
ncbi:MAG TPA: hypothetical protein VK569_09885 [Bacteroidota bacterium]|nr:hypothetical protein [Bacteroidota bacterium]